MAIIRYYADGKMNQNALGFCLESIVPHYYPVELVKESCQSFMELCAL